MKLDYKKNIIEENKIPSVVRALKVGDLVSLIGEEEGVKGKVAGHVIGINFVTPKIKRRSKTADSFQKVDYAINLHPLHPSAEATQNINQENLNEVPVSIIKKYCVIESKSKSY